MNDIFLEWSGDIAFGPTGDLAIATGSNALTQRVCRRLITNAGDYLWQLDYGASLSTFVGLQADPAQIEGVIRSQLLLESEIPTSPPPTVSVTVTDRTNGIVSASITYADPVSFAPVAMTVSATSADPL